MKGPAIAIIGAGPSGLFAAEFLAGQGAEVTLFDRMASAGRKFLLAGRGGLNLTHSEPCDAFLRRYGAASPLLADAVRAFPPEALRNWAEGLGQKLFVGSSGRVFPAAMKAAPLLRAWLRRLDAQGVRFAPRHCWQGWTADGALRFKTPSGEVLARPDAAILAVGGASWPRLGSDGAWADLVRAEKISVAALRPSNCGVLVAWSDLFAGRFQGAPLKRIAVTFGGKTARGEAIITAQGLKGGVIYALSAQCRAALDSAREAWLTIDLRPDLDLDNIAARANAPRGGLSLSNFLRKHLGLAPPAIGLVQEARHQAGRELVPLPNLIKALPLRVTGLAPIARAISTAGGVAFDELTGNFMLRRLPGVFAAGEMLDWDAPTGGYLLQACFSTSRAAAAGAWEWTNRQTPVGAS